LCGQDATRANRLTAFFFSRQFAALLLRLWFLVLLVCVSAFAPTRAGARMAENRTWDLFLQTVETRLETELQVAATHQEYGLFNYEHAPG